MSCDLLLTMTVLAIQDKLEKIDMNLAEFTTELAALNANLEKSRSEILGKIAELETQLANVSVPPEVVAALDSLKISAASLDMIVPDPVA